MQEEAARDYTSKVLTHIKDKALSTATENIKEGLENVKEGAE
jgi:hypothetical protein